VHSNTQYSFYSQKAEDPETFSSTRNERHNARFRLEHSLYNNLFSFGRLRALQNNSELVDQTEYEAGAGATYSKTFFSELDLSLNVQADYRYTDRQTEDGLEDVINELHTASFVEPIILGQALVQQETIRVTSQDGFTYMEGFDYEVIDLGQLFTEIRILPGGQISLGERLLVSYKYVPFPSAEFNTLNSGYGLSLGYRWLHFFHSESQSTNKLESGAIPPPDRHDRTTGFELSFLHDKFEVRARAESRYREIGGSETRSYQMSQSLFLPGKGKFNFSFSGSQVFTESRGSVFLDPRIDEDFLNQMRDSDYYAFDARLNWFPRRNLRISPRLGYWSRKEKTTTNVVIETDREYLFGGLDVSWYLRQLLVEFSYQRNTSSSNTAGDIGEDIDTVDDRVMLTIRRQFR
jgi:hypothetical protein